MIAFVIGVIFLRFSLIMFVHNLFIDFLADKAVFGLCIP